MIGGRGLSCSVMFVTVRNKLFWVGTPASGAINVMILVNVLSTTV